ncbi:hypothetical protein CBR_g48329 [Chara braunii]|uniref:CCHC-type domain-containing protein n=1 Tax=Chara braunii TaxID=69332 RepID=A0A388K492_CHABU|nr:hypothetical protein CBR_g48329 [Chara braunii]|eukprot:GBG64861.1 hypothetical protein CBR_g48329 [Chara braunii]
MPETGGASGAPKRDLTLDDLIAAIDGHERNPSNIPKVDTFHFCGERVSEWLERVEQALVGRSDVVKFQRILQYVLYSYHQEVKKVIDAAQGSWERFKEGVQRKYRLGDGLLTTADLEAMNKEDFTTIGAFVQEFKKRARKVHGISEEAHCAIFLGLLTASEAVELTRHGGGSTKLTWATIDRGVEVGCLDQVEQRQVRLQRQKRKERDATASGTPGVTRIVKDVLAQLGYATEPVVQRRVVTAVQVKGKEPVIEEAVQEELWEEEESVLQRLTKAQRKHEQEVKASANQEPPRREPESGKRKEAVEVEDDDDEEEEDERLRREENQKAEQRARKKGTAPPKKKKYAVRLEEGFDVEKVIDRLLKGHNDLMTLKEILASASRLRDELKGRLSRRLVPNVHLGKILPKEAEWAESERNYSQFKMETLIVLHCLRIFRNYIFGRRFILRVDPTALAYSLRNYVSLDPTVARWLTYIWMFNFELERIPGSKNRADGLSRINWDNQEGEAVENTPPVDGILDQKLDVRLHINKWSPRVPSCVDYPIWQALSGYERRAELVLKPFEEEDPWGGKDVQWMMELALANSHSLMEDIRTIEEGPGQVEGHEDLMGGMYLLVNTLLQESLDHSGSLNPAGNVDEVPESQDDEFEKGEIKEAFRAEEYHGIYLELGLLLSCEMRLRDASDRTQRMLQRYLVRDGHLFVRREVGNPRRVVCGRNRQIDVVAALHDGIAGGHRGVQATYAKISELYYWDGMMDMVGKFCRSCVPCQERSRLRQGEPLHPRLEREVGAVVHLDLLFMPLGDQGYTYIFDARDNLSGFVDGRAIRTKTGLVLVSCIEEYYLRYPFVRKFVMDRGSEFTYQEVQELLSRYDFTKTAMPRGGRGTRPPRRSLGASGGYERHGPHHRESTPVYDDGDIELFLDNFWDHARRMGWTVAHVIERLRGAGRFEELVARISREATTRSEVEWRMQELRPSPVGPNGRPIRLEIGNASDFIPAFEWFMQGRGIPKDDWMQTLPLWTRKAERPLASQRDPEPREARPSRGGRKALARREEEPEPEAEERGAYPEYGLGPVEFHQFAEGELRRSPARTQEGPPASEEPLRELEAHLDISQWRASPRGEERGEQAEEVPREGVPREEVPQEEVQDTQRKRGLGDEERRAGKEVIEVGEDTPPQTPAVGLRLGDAPGSTRQAGERLQREEAPLPSSEKAPSPEERAERRKERAAVRREALTLIDRHLAAHALEHPDLEEPTPAEPRHEPCQPEKEMEAKIPKRVDLRTRERVLAGETAEEKRARRTRRIKESLEREMRTEAEGVIEGGLQRLGTPEYGPEGIEDRWGPSTQEMEAREEPLDMPQSHELSREASEAPSSPGSQRGKKRSRKWFDTSCFFCTKEGHQALQCPKFLKDKAEGKVTEEGGMMYDRQGWRVERSADGGRAQLYRQIQEETGLSFPIWLTCCV